VIEDGETTGYNTDWRGAIGALEEAASLDVNTAEVIGSGGVARAIAYGLQQNGVDVFVSARSRPQRAELAGDLELSGETDLDGQGEAGAELVVNATPIADQPDSPVDFDRHTEAEWLLDVVFDKKETDIVREARARGWHVSPGWRMLLHQALKQFELYTGVDAPARPMSEILENALSD
jgi:shikimate dehydrogenase